MVRYPKKNVEQSPIKIIDNPAIKPVPIIENEIKQVTPKLNISEPIVVKNVSIPEVPSKKVSDEKVEELLNHIRSLEEKVETLERGFSKDEPVVKPDKPKKVARPSISWDLFRNKIRGYVLALTVLLVVLTGIKIFYVVSNPPYQALMVFKVDSSLEKIPGFTSNLKRDELINTIKTLPFVTSVVSHNWGWARFLNNQSWIMYPVAVFTHDRIKVEQGKEPSLIIVKVRSFRPEKSKELIKAIQTALLEYYEKESRKRLGTALAILSGSVEENKKKLKVIYQKMAEVKSIDQMIPVKPTVKNNLDNLGIVQALELEQMLATLKNQLKMLNMQNDKIYSTISEDILFKMFYNKLSDMEFNKLLIPKDFVAEYDDGMRKVKTKLVNEINDGAKRGSISQNDSNLFISWVMINARIDSLERALNKRYAVQEVLTGQQAEYARLKQQSEVVALSLENFLYSKELILKTLDKKLSNDVSIDTPVIIIKK